MLWLIMVLLLGGFGGGYYGYRRGCYVGGGFGIASLVVIVLIVFLVLDGGFGHGIYYR